nr:ankyrin repeat domain-containing protein [Xenococcaceae cyanobacterium MO_167.B27]
PPVIHRDIKPNNIIYSDEGKIYLVDFGAVQNTYYNSLMQGSTVVGTYGYMAPEQFRGKAVSATDLYSLGATLLYLLTHRSPAELPQDTLKLDFRNSVAISESFADWLEQMLEPDTEDRFATAEVALSKLFASKKLKQKRLITSLSLGVLVVSAIFGLNSDKWWFLTRLGFYPDNMCSSEVLQRFFEQGGDINYISTQEKIAIFNCIFKKYDPTETWNHKGVAQLLINDGADVNTRYYSRKTPLFWTRNKDVAQLLINNGADVNAQDKDGQTPLFGIENKDVAQLLINNGADVNFQDNSGQTPLFGTGNKDIAQLLINNGADVNAQDNMGRTPLLEAASSRRIDIAQVLINNGADVNVPDNMGRTPLSIAVLKFDQELTTLLINNGVNSNFMNYETISRIYGLNIIESQSIKKFLEKYQSIK